jgi:hypothetical protein
MPGFLRVILGPILGTLVGAFAGWVQLKTGVVLSPDDQAGLIASATAIGGVVGTLVKRFVDGKWLNPGNASSPTLAKVEKAEVDGEVARSDRLIREIDAETRKL